jgi:hypothetical protein
MAKNSLERYTHYYERWATNESVSVRLVKCAVCPLIFLLSLHLQFKWLEIQSQYQSFC